jgi:outer membrane protein TolC
MPSILIFLLLTLSFISFGASVNASSSIPNSPLAFTKAIQAALEHSTEVRIKRRSLLAAKESAFQGKMNFLPTVSSDLRKIKTETESVTTTDQNDFTTSLSLNLYKFGGDISKMESRENAQRAASMDFLKTVLFVEKKASDSILNLIEAERRKEIIRNIVESRKELLRISEQRRRKGIISRQEVQKILVDLANDESRLSDSKITLKNAKADLENLLGHSSVKTVWPMRKRFMSKKGINRVTRGFNVEKHPRWRMSKFSLKVAENDLSQAKSVLFPSLDFSLSHSKVFPRVGDNYDSFSTAVTLSIPWFKRFSDHTVYENKIHAKSQKEFQLTQAARDLKRSWDSGLNEFENSLESALIREKTLKTSRDLYQANLKRFRSGRAPANELILDERRHLETEILTVNGWKTVHQSFINLCHTKGLTIAACLLSMSSNNQKTF